MDADLSHHVPFVMDDCPQLHSRDNNQEDTVSLILTREAVVSGPKRTAHSFHRDAKRAKHHSFFC
jgi:hypothetical protein